MSELSCWYGCISGSVYLPDWQAWLVILFFLLLIKGIARIDSWFEEHGARYKESSFDVPQNPFEPKIQETVKKHQNKQTGSAEGEK